MGLWLWWLGSTALSLVFAYFLVDNGWVQGPTRPNVNCSDSRLGSYS